MPSENLTSCLFQSLEKNCVRPSLLGETTEGAKMVNGTEKETPYTTCIFSWCACLNFRVRGRTNIVYTSCYEILCLETCIKPVIRKRRTLEGSRHIRATSGRAETLQNSCSSSVSRVVTFLPHYRYSGNSRCSCSKSKKVAGACE